MISGGVGGFSLVARILTSLSSVVVVVVESRIRVANWSWMAVIGLSAEEMVSV